MLEIREHGRDPKLRSILPGFGRDIRAHEIRGRDSSDTLVIVKIKEAGKDRTSVKIRPGVVKPDLAMAQKLCQAIEKRC